MLQLFVQLFVVCVFLFFVFCCCGGGDGSGGGGGGSGSGHTFFFVCFVGWLVGWLAGSWLLSLVDWLVFACLFCLGSFFFLFFFEDQTVLI